MKLIYLFLKEVVNNLKYMESLEYVKNLQDKLDNIQNLSKIAWGSEELANYMSQGNDNTSDSSDNEEIPEGAMLDNMGLYYWIKNENGFGESRWRTKKQLQKMEKQRLEDEKYGLWDKFHSLSTRDWNNAVKLSSDIIKLKSEILDAKKDLKIV